MKHNDIPKPEKDKLIIGIDLGGTKIGIALVNRNGQIKDYLKTSTLAEQGREKVVGRLLQNICHMINKSRENDNEISGIGIGIPGPVNSKLGIVNFAPNLPGWDNVPIKNILEKELNIPVKIENDANAAAWGEKIYGVAQGVNDLICITLGTGVGGGLILDGKIYHGKNFYAGEIGHMVVNKEGPQCNCGGYGCLEVYSSATGIRNRIFLKIEESKKNETISRAIAEIDFNIGLAKIFQQAREGHPVFHEIVNEAIEYLGMGITSLVNLLNPEMIVLAGGIANEGDNLLKPIKKIVFQRAMSSHLEDFKLVLGSLGDFAGVIGSAALFWDAEK
ncbi:MAG: ROK family protein [Atribacterota bacterium]|nr:ROK family protein [Atribacterota bacterium]